MGIKYKPVQSILNEIQQQISMLDTFNTDAFGKEVKKILVSGCQKIAQLRDTNPELMQVLYNQETEELKVNAIFDSIRKHASQRFVCPIIPDGTFEVFSSHGIGLELPAFAEWQNPKGIKHNFVIPSKSGKKSPVQYAERLLLNMLLMFPASKLKFTFVDVSMQGTMIPFTEGLEQALYKNVMDQQGLTETLNRLQSRMTEIIPQYTNIEKFNAERKTIEIPYEVIVLVNYPNKISGSDIERMTSIFENGHKAGIYFVVLSDDNYTWEERSANLLRIQNYSEVVQDIIVQVRQTAITHTPFYSIESLRKAAFKYINEAYKEEKGKKPVYAPPTYSATEYQSTDVELVVPIGRTKDQAVEFRLDCIDHIHSFIIGQSGSGKSVLLHSILAAMIQKYSPEDLMLYMLDFKLGGVEFNRYRNVNHVKALLVDNNDDNITLEILRDVMEQMTIRGRMLRDAGVSDIKTYNQKHLDAHMPQIIFVVDECHELFKVGENGGRHKLQDEIVKVVNKISKEGRSQGVHLLMATQTLSGAQIDQGILNNVTDHYLLKCAPADSDRLVDRSSKYTCNQTVGQVFYNHTGEHYQFRSFFLPNEELTTLVEKAAEKSSSYRNNGKFYFSGSQVFHIDKKVAESCMTEKDICASLGCSIDLKQSPTLISLEPDFCENVMLFGIDDKEQVTRTTMDMLVTMIMDNRQKHLGFKFYVVDCLGPDLAPNGSKLLNELEANGLCRVFRSRDERGEILLQLAEEVGKEDAEPSIFFILGQHRFKELRRNAVIKPASELQQVVPADTGSSIDTGSLSRIEIMKAKLAAAKAKQQKLSQPQQKSSANANMRYQEALDIILNEGPEKHVHTVLQIDKPEHLLFMETVSANKIYSRFGHFIMLHADENAASKLNVRSDIRLQDLSGENERLRAYYYSYMEDTYKLFSSYMIPESETIKLLTK